MVFPDARHFQEPRQILAPDDHSQVIVRPRLLAEESVDAPATIKSDLNAVPFKQLHKFDDIAARHGHLVITTNVESGIHHYEEPSPRVGSA